MKDSNRDLFKRPSAKLICVVVGLCFILLAAVCVRVFCGSMHAYQQGEEYFKKNQYIEAITFFDRSIHWYTPFNPYVGQSAQRLWEICVQAEQKGDTQLALIAARTIRQGFLGTRSFYAPGRDWISRCDRKIASLMAKEFEGQEMNRENASSFSTHKDPQPNVFWTLVLEVGLFGWIGSVMAFVMRGLTRGHTPRLRSKPALFWGIMIIIFYTLWIVGMVRS